MATKTRSSSIFIFFAVLAFALVAHAASIFDITYPIAELGNCSDRAACKAYCDVAAHQSACEAFAQQYGLTVHTQAQSQSSQSSSQGTQQGQGDSQQAMQAAIAQDGGPGQCGVGASDPVSACRDYCNVSAHLQECVQYGESHGMLSGSRLQDAQKVAAALKNGVQLPSGCTDAQSCRQTCQNPSSLAQARSCFAFAKAAGILPPGFNEAKAEKVFTAIQNGTAPFKSMQDFQQCQNATDPAIIKKCTDFAVQAGMMTQQQADVIQKTSGKGPGGCVGPDACNAYCKTHQSECFQFAKQNGLIPQSQLNQMQQGATQMQQMLQQAPSAVRQCIVSAIGQKTIDAITSGAQPPGPDFGQQMQQCFQQNAQQGGPQGSGAPCPPPMSASSTSQSGNMTPCIPPQGQQGQFGGSQQGQFGPNGQPTQGGQGQYGGPMQGGEGQFGQPPCPPVSNMGSSTPGNMAPCVPQGQHGGSQQGPRRFGPNGAPLGPNGQPLRGGQGQYGPPPCPPAASSSSAAVGNTPPCAGMPLRGGQGQYGAPCPASADATNPAPCAGQQYGPPPQGQFSPSGVPLQPPPSTTQTQPTSMSHSLLSQVATVVFSLFGAH